ncbi:MAG: hypothetical protein ACUZ8O_17380, partial [Candidatus Anammoxibacter sp.]
MNFLAKFLSKSVISCFVRYIILCLTIIVGIDTITAQEVVTTIDIGKAPSAFGINPETNLIYVLHAPTNITGIGSSGSISVSV